MNLTDVTLTREELHKLFAAGDPEAAMVLLALRCGNTPAQLRQGAGQEERRLERAVATLRQLGLWQEPRPRLELNQPPVYTETDVTHALARTEDFPLLTGEVQRVLGRLLTTEELKILLVLRNYLGLPGEVVSLLVSYCKERMLRRGINRNPSLRSIEKEAFLWAEKGIDTMEEAVAYIQTQNARYSRLGMLTRVLQIGGRSLTAAEERYAAAWLEMGFDQEAFQLAYEKTCLNTGGLKWAYMDKILQS